MEFTDAFPSFGIAARLSPNGQHVAALLKGEGALSIAIYSSRNGELRRQLMAPSDTVERRDALMFGGKCDRWELLWSPDSTQLALFNGLAATILVWGIDWEGSESLLPISCIRENQMLGVDRVLWTPDSVHILAFLAHRVGVRLWRMDRRLAQACFTHPKYSLGEKGVCFSEDGRWMGMLHRRNLDDFIVTYSVSSDGTWEAVQTVKTPESANLEDICFAPLRDVRSLKRPSIVAWESPAFSSRIFVFSPDGASCKVISHDLPEETIMEETNTSPTTSGPVASLLMRGFERLIWSRTGWIAVVIKDSITFGIWNAITQRMGSQIIVGPGAVQLGSTIVFKEKVIKELRPDGMVTDRSKYESGFQLQLSDLKCGSRGKASNVQTRLMVEFSHDSTFIAAHSGQYLNCLWIYNVVEMSLVAILHQLQPIRGFSWNDTSSSLVVITESLNLFVWQPSGCLCIPQPAVKDPRTVKWAPHCDTLLIGGAHSFTLAVPDWTTY